MSTFAKFAERVHQNFTAMAARTTLFTVDLGDDLYDAYLAAFPEGTNPVFRERTEHDCSCCKNFIRNLGSVITIEGGDVHTVWDNSDDLPEPYNLVSAKLRVLILETMLETGIADLFVTDQYGYGNEFTLELLEDQSTRKWHHFHGRVPTTAHSRTPDARRGEYRTAQQVLRRAVEEISPAAVTDVIALIEGDGGSAGGNLYRGDEYLSLLKAFQEVQTAYRDMPSIIARDVFCWLNATVYGGGIRNTAIGTLLVDLSEGMEIDKAVFRFEEKMDPTRYKQPRPVFTPGMVKKAMETIQEHGLEPALDRRHATKMDLHVNDVLWADNQARKHMQGIEALLMESTTSKAPKALKDGEQIGIEDFVRDVLPTAVSMEIFMRSDMQSKLVSVTAPVHANVAPLFKWDNNFALSYNGNVTDSIKEKVKKAGGNTSAPFRVSLAWFNGDDLDIHCRTPDGAHVFFGNKVGILDVDENAGYARNTTDPVENMSWQRVPDGIFKFWVHQYTLRNRNNVGFVVQIENNGAVSEYRYNMPVYDTVAIGKITIKNGCIVEMQLNPELVGGGIEQEVWGIKTENYVPVDTIMLSPNHWGSNATGNKHWVFTLQGCKNPEPTRGIYNEYLRPELEKHRKVLQMVGMKTMCEPADEQLSGVGFSSTRRDTALIRVNNGSRTFHYEVAF